MSFPESVAWILFAFTLGVGCGVKLLHWRIKRGWSAYERKKTTPANEPHDVKPNVYDNPEKCGLQPIFELSEPDLDWAYNQMLLFRHRKSGRLFYVSEEGGSCPQPFEDHHFSSPDNTSLTEITPGDSWTSFLREVDSFPIDHEARTNMIETAGFYLSQRPQPPIS